MVMDSKNCISCFCCQEMCPVHAIGVKRTWKR
jgi:formate hydrogenlyase subunit 6/NADH:ubiquinone oxidoreductase subunit I